MVIAEKLKEKKNLILYLNIYIYIYIVIITKYTYCTKEPYMKKKAAELTV